MNKSLPFEVLGGVAVTAGTNTVGMIYCFCRGQSDSSDCVWLVRNVPSRCVSDCAGLEFDVLTSVTRTAL